MRSMLDLTLLFIFSRSLMQHEKGAWLDSLTIPVGPTVSLRNGLLEKLCVLESSPPEISGLAKSLHSITSLSVMGKDY